MDKLSFKKLSYRSVFYGMTSCKNSIRFESSFKIDIKLFFLILSHFYKLHGHTFPFSFSFTLKNEGEVSLSYSWSVQPGTYRPPTPQDQKALPSKSNRRTPTSRDSGKTQSSRGQGGAKSKQEQTQRKSRVERDGRSSTSSEAHRASTVAGRVSQLAHSMDGRPTSAMTLAYDAGSTSDPIRGMYEKFHISIHNLIVLIKW